MSRQYQIVNVATSTFNNWIDKTNDIISLVNTDVVTVSSNNVGDLTTGNGFVIGIFGSNTITATSIRGGNVQTSAAVSLVSNVNFTAAQVNATANVYINAANVYLSTNTLVTMVGNTFVYSANGSQKILSVFSNATHYGLSANVNADFDLTGNAALRNAVTVSGTTTLSSVANFNGVTTVANSFTVTGYANLQGTTNVGGTFGVSGLTTLSSNLNVVGKTTLSTVDINTSANVNGVLTSSANANFVNTYSTYTIATNLVGNTLNIASNVVYANSSGLYSNYYSGSISASSNGFSANSTTITVGNTSVNTTITQNSVSSNTGYFYNLNVLGQIIGTLSATGNFIPSPNNAIWMGSSANVFNQVFVTNTYTNAISGYAGGTVNMMSDINVTSRLSYSTNNYVSSNLFSFSSTSQATIDSWAISTFRSAEYFLQFTDTATTSYHVTKLVVYHDGSNAYSTEFAQLFNNSSLATITTDVSGGNVRILVTPASSSVVTKFNRNLFTV